MYNWCQLSGLREEKHLQKKTVSTQQFEHTSSANRVAEFNLAGKCHCPEFISYFQIFITFYLSHKSQESIFCQEVYKVLGDNDSKLVSLLVLAYQNTTVWVVSTIESYFLPVPEVQVQNTTEFISWETLSSICKQSPCGCIEDDRLFGHIQRKTSSYGNTSQ